MSTFDVKFAVYGALKDGNENETQAISVAQQLQRLLEDNDGIVTISNSSFGVDPAKGYTKHFGAIVNVNGEDVYFACQENQTIDFAHHIQPTAVATTAN